MAKGLVQYVIIPRDPEMSKGKIASQTAHATLLAIDKQQEHVKNILTPHDDGLCCGSTPWDNLDRWKETGMCVVVLECPTQVELMNIATYCNQWGVPNHLYIDEGLTEIPMGTATAFATGVIPENKQWMFSRMKMFTEDKKEVKRWWIKKQKK